MQSLSKHLMVHETLQVWWRSLESVLCWLHNTFSIQTYLLARWDAGMTVFPPASGDAKALVLPTGHSAPTILAFLIPQLSGHTGWGGC